MEPRNVIAFSLEWITSAFEVGKNVEVGWGSPNVLKHFNVNNSLWLYIVGIIVYLYRTYEYCEVTTQSITKYDIDCHINSIRDSCVPRKLKYLSIFYRCGCTFCVLYLFFWQYGLCFYLFETSNKSYVGHEWLGWWSSSFSSSAAYGIGVTCTRFVFHRTML